MLPIHHESAGIPKNPSSGDEATKTGQWVANRAHHIRLYMNTPFVSYPARRSEKNGKNTLFFIDRHVPQGEP